MTGHSAGGCRRRRRGLTLRSMTRSRIALAVLAVAAVLPLTACQDKMSSAEQTCRDFYANLGDNTGMQHYYEGMADQKCGGI